MLLVDAGNSRIKWRLTEGAKLTSSGTLPSNEYVKLAEAIGNHPVNAACVCSVLGEVANAHIRQTLELSLGVAQSHQHWLSAPKVGYGIVNDYQPAESLGADRFAALVAAHHRQSIDWIIVNVGTAITVDLLGADGHYYGGAIAPGPELMRNALVKDTAGVNIDIAIPSLEMPTNTKSAVSHGIGSALWGVVAGMLRQSHRSGKSPSVLLSGGARVFLRPFLDVEVVEVDNVVLEGLAWIAQDLGYVD